MRFRASANTSDAVSKGCSRMSLRTKLAFFIPALRDLRASRRSSSSVNRTVRIAIVLLRIDVCHLYVKVLVSAGMLNKLIAAKLGISEITVKAHRGNVMRKMQAQSLPDLVTMAESLGVRLRAR
jgi:FixJ family two-component response regulator